MTYFTKFPFTDYVSNNKTVIIRDFFRRSVFLTEYKPLSDLYQSYTISEGETPHYVAGKFYGSQYYHWVVLIFNEIYDQQFDWPLDQVSLENLCKDRYGPITMYQTRHFERDNNIIGEYKEFFPGTTWVSPINPGVGDPTVYPVSFIEWESRLNDEKRKIKILRPELLSEFVKQYEASING
jgi:Base plate wedge protein 53